LEIERRLRWLRSPEDRLDGLVPFRLLRTALGGRWVEEILWQIDEGAYPLEQIEDPMAQVSYRVQRMKLSKDKTALRYNDFLALSGIPAAFDYRLGNRSAPDRVIDQYRVSTAPRSGILNAPTAPTIQASSRGDCRQVR
jgi:hypothetical protein